MKKILIKLLVIIGVLIPTNISLAEGPEYCSRDGYTIITLNGMLTTESGALSNKEKIEILLQGSFNNQKITVDYVYNTSHEFIADLTDSITQKMSEGLVSETYDLKKMIIDLSKKVKTQKLLFVAHSQGNFYSNDIYNSIGDKEGGIAKASMGIYGIGTPTSYIAGNGRYILSKNDGIINKVRLYGALNVLPANVTIPKDPNDDLDGHGLTDSYLKYQNKRIAAEILSMLHGLKDDPTQDVNAPCIDTPRLTGFDKFIGKIYFVLDPVVDTLGDVGSFLVDNIGKPITNGINKLSKNYADLLNGLFSSAWDIALGINSTPVTSNKSDKVETNQNSETIENKNNETSGESNLVAISNNTTIVVDEDDDRDQEKNVIETNKKTSGGGGHSSHSKSTNNNHSDNPNQDEDVDDSDDTTGDGDTGDDDTNTEEDDDEEEIVTPPTEPKDSVPPVIILTGGEYIKLANGSDYFEYGAEASDETDGKINVTVEHNVDMYTDGVYTVVYKAQDKAGNFSTKERRVEVYTPLPGLIINEDTELIAGEYFFDNVTITNNATLKLLSDIESVSKDFRGVKIHANNMTIDAGSSISADNQGFFIGEGSSFGNQSGGSYGGVGELSTEDFVYGSAFTPKDLGSAGSIQNNYYRGGGAIWLEVEDTLTNNGVVSANGWSNASGGSVYVKTKNLEGDGSFNADGGGLTSNSVFYYPGGGGRVAVHYDNSSFTGEVEANAGCGHVGYPDLDCGEDGTAGMFDEKNNILYVDKSWEFTSYESPFDINEMQVSDMAKIKFQEGAKVKIGKLTLSDFSQMILTGEEDLYINNFEMHDNTKVTAYTEKILKLFVDNIDLEDYATIDVQSLGYQNGPGTPEEEYWGNVGASYGGKGGGDGAKPTYGDKDEPTDFGSGTDGFRGGGAIYVVAKNNFINNGSINASGYRRRTSGGSIYVKTNSLSGSGAFWAKGANGEYAYGNVYGIAGGGGRIAIYYKENTFTGEKDASAGNFCFYGCAPGAENGTVVLVDEDNPVIPPVVVEEESSENEILSFTFEDFAPVIVGDIDSVNNTIYATVPYGTNVASLIPTITISSDATVDAESLVPQDFSSPVIYIVTAQDGGEKSYTVIVNIDREDGDEGTDIPIDNIPPIITEYMINGTTEDIETDPTKHNVVIEIEAEEDVDWVSIMVENVDNPSIDKRFLSGENCEDWTSTCAKTWIGDISSSAYSLQEGVYQVKVHIKDLAGNETNYTLPTIINVIKEEGSESGEIVIL
ncbi:MAG: DUF5011 domain-containing protein [Candidatus Moranbacteria bacterium]|nr:DUF5011 domain-containing protein [Candidatus Moranbacteria bacterium]